MNLALDTPHKAGSGI